MSLTSSKLKGRQRKKPAQITSWFSLMTDLFTGLQFKPDYGGRHIPFETSGGLQLITQCYAPEDILFILELFFSFLAPWKPAAKWTVIINKKR